MANGDSVECGNYVEEIVNFGGIQGFIKFEVLDCDILTYSWCNVFLVLLSHS